MREEEQGIVLLGRLIGFNVEARAYSGSDVSSSGVVAEESLGRLPELTVALLGGLGRPADAPPCATNSATACRTRSSQGLSLIILPLMKANENSILVNWGTGLVG